MADSAPPPEQGRFTPSAVDRSEVLKRLGGEHQARRSPPFVITHAVSGRGEGVLLGLLHELQGRPGRGRPGGIRYNVLAALATSLGSTSALTLVVDRASEEPQTVVELQSEANWLAARMSRAAPGLHRRTRSWPHPRPGSGTAHPPIAVALLSPETIGRRPSDPVPREPFDDTVLGEVRFGLRRRDHRTPQVASACLRRFSAELRRRDTAAAYVRYPSSGPAAPHVDGTRVWMRVGYALPCGRNGRPLHETVGAGAEIERAAARLATEYGLGLHVYNGDVSQPRFADRFSAVIDVVPTAPDPAGAMPAGRPDRVPGRPHAVVFHERHAPGLLDTLLEPVGDGIGLHGLTLSIVYGYATAIRVTATAVEDGSLVPFLAADVADPLEPPVGDRVTLWVAWACNDKPGMFEQVLETLTTALDAADGRPTRSWRDQAVRRLRRRLDTRVRYNLDYAISRVVGDTRRVAGKFKMSLDRAGAEQLGVVAMGVIDEQWKGQLTEQLTDMLCRETRTSPSDFPFGNGPVVVSGQEPTQEPWGSPALAVTQYGIVLPSLSDALSWQVLRPTTEPRD